MKLTPAMIKTLERFLSDAWYLQSVNGVNGNTARALEIRGLITKGPLMDMGMFEASHVPTWALTRKGYTTIAALVWEGQTGNNR